MTIMTTSIQTSAFSTMAKTRRNRNKFWQMVINEEDGNFQQFEIEAPTYEEAYEQANSLAMMTGADLTYVELYEL